MTKETNKAVEKEHTSCSVLLDGSRAQGACSEDLEGRLGCQGPSYWKNIVILALGAAPRSVLISGLFSLFMPWGPF